VRGVARGVCAVCVCAVCMACGVLCVVWCVCGAQYSVWGCDAWCVARGVRV
jgi:hypothetical protein